MSLVSIRECSSKIECRYHLFSPLRLQNNARKIYSINPQCLYHYWSYEIWFMPSARTWTSGGRSVSVNIGQYWAMITNHGIPITTVLLVIPWAQQNRFFKAKKYMPVTCFLIIFKISSNWTHCKCLSSCQVIPKMYICTHKWADIRYLSILFVIIRRILKFYFDL